MRGSLESTRGNLKQILDAKERGIKIISIKPTMEPDVALSDTWIAIRPGTDNALALAMLNVIISEKLYDSRFAAEWTYGFEKLEKHIAKYPPKWAEPITGFPADQITDLAPVHSVEFLLLAWFMQGGFSNGGGISIKRNPKWRLDLLRMRP